MGIPLTAILIGTFLAIVVRQVCLVIARGYDNTRLTQQLAASQQRIAALERQVLDGRAQFQALRQRLVNLQDALNRLESQAPSGIGRLRLADDGQIVEE